jgi:multicomponent Na+:H+ antiporter subunit D
MQLDLFIIPEMSTVMPVLLPIAFAVLIAVLSAVALLVSKKEIPALPAIIAVIGFAVSVLYVYLLGVEVWANETSTYVWSWAGETFAGPMGVVLAADKLSVVLMGLFSIMGLVVSIYSIGYMKEDTGLTQYYVLLMIMVGAMNGVVISGDLFTLFIFYETMGLSSFVLVAFRRSWEGIEAAIKYLMMSAIGSTLVLLSASYLYGLTGTLNLGAMAVALSTSTNPLLPILVAIMTAGFGVKGAIVPFAAWLADAHPAAPSGISAMLSGVVIKVGVYGIIRMNVALFSPVTVNWPLLLAIFAAVTMTAGNFYALTQTDLKRMLAYSSITQIGFILYSFGTATAFGYQTGIFYIIIHAFTKGLLFLCAGAFLHAIGSRDLEDLRGIGKKMPIVSAFFAIGILSLMGMPPFAGFYAKLLILLAGVQAGGYYLLFTVIAVFNALFALGYYLRMISTVWFSPVSKAAEAAHRPGISMLFGMGILALALIVIGIYPAPIFNLAVDAGTALMNGDFITAILGTLTP